MDREICYSIIALLAYLLVGVTRSYLAFLIYQLDLQDSTIALSREQKSWLASCVSLLTPIGCLFSGFLMDFFGRKLFLRAVFLPFVISWILISFAWTIEMLYVGIALQSVGIGMSFCVATYVAEISSTHRRGALLSILEVTHSVGVILCYVAMSFLRWNVVAIGNAICSLIFLALASRMPESPVWLYSKGEKEKSIRTLTKLRRLPRDALEDEILDMEKASSESGANASTLLRDIVDAWKPLLMVLVMFVLMQHTGFLIMVSFIVMLVERMRIPFKSSDVSIMYAASGFVSSCLTPFTIHNFGRKITLALSAFFMAMSMAIIGVYEELYYASEEKPVPWIVPLAVVVYIFACTLGVYPISFMMGGEVFPNEARGVLNGIYGALGFAYSTMLFKVFPSFIEFLGIKGTIWTFAAFGFVLTLYAVFVLPETRGKTLNEIQEKYFRVTRSKIGKY